MRHLDELWGNVKNRILSYLLKLEKKGYTIPINDKNNELFTQNKFVNSCIFIADIICIFITLLGMAQQLITFFGVLTYSVYTLCDQVKIFYEQHKCLQRDYGFFQVKNSSRHRKIPPNLPNVIFVGIISCILIAFSILKATGGILNIYFYYIVILSAFVVLFYIKVKYILFDVFGITKWRYIIELRTEKEVKV